MAFTAITLVPLITHSHLHILRKCQWKTQAMCGTCQKKSIRNFKLKGSNSFDLFIVWFICLGTLKILNHLFFIQKNTCSFWHQNEFSTTLEQKKMVG